MHEWIAAVAAIVAAVVVGYQSWQTKRSADASLAAVRAANAALELSRDSLELARTEERNTQRLILEGIKTRLDAGAQWIKVDASTSAAWPYEPSITGGEANPIAQTHQYQRPKDDAEQIIVRVSFKLFNEGPRSVIVAIGPWRPAGAPAMVSIGNGRYELPAGSTQNGTFDVSKSVSEWIELHEVITAGGFNQASCFSVFVTNDGDEGVIDRYDILVNGSPLVPIENHTGGWQFNPGQYFDFEKTQPVVSALAQPGKRAYYISKRNQELLEPETPT